MVAELLLVSASAEATEALAEQLGRLVEADAVLALDGDLGSGKTTFVRGLARGLEVSVPVSSPTYTLMQSYPGRLELYHFDAWMEGREAAFLDGGGAEWLHAGGVAVVEWAARVADWLPADRLAVELLHRSAPTYDEWGHPTAEAERGLAVRAGGPLSEALLDRLLALGLPDGIASSSPEAG